MLAKLKLLIGVCFLLDQYKIGNWRNWNLFLLLYSTEVDRNEEDKVLWLVAQSVSFEVKLYCTTLLSRGSHSFPWKGIWNVKASSKESVFHLDNCEGEDSHIG